MVFNPPKMLPKAQGLPGGKGHYGFGKTSASFTADVEGQTSDNSDLSDNDPYDPNDPDYNDPDPNSYVVAAIGGGVAVHARRAGTNWLKTHQAAMVTANAANQQASSSNLIAANIGKSNVQKTGAVKTNFGPGPGPGLGGPRPDGLLS